MGGARASDLVGDRRDQVEDETRAEVVAADERHVGDEDALVEVRPRAAQVERHVDDRGDVEGEQGEEHVERELAVDAADDWE